MVMLLLQPCLVDVYLLSNELEVLLLQPNREEIQIPVVSSVVDL